MNRYTVCLTSIHPMGMHASVSYKVKAETTRKARSCAYFAFLMDFGRLWNIKEIHVSGWKE